MSNGVEKHTQMALAALGDWIEITDDARRAATAVIRAFAQARRPEQSGRERVPSRSQVAQQMVRDSLQRHDRLNYEGRRGLRIGLDILEAVSRQWSAGTDYPIYRKA